MSRGSAAWTDRSYGFLSAPGQLLSGGYSYQMVEMDGNPPCSNEGGFVGSVSRTSTVAICCAMHHGPQPGPRGNGVSGWRRVGGTYALSNHGGTPCGFWEGTLSANTNTQICCARGWATGVFFAGGPDTTTTTTTTGRGVYRDTNASFHQAFSRIASVVNQTNRNTETGEVLSTLVSLVVANQEQIDNTSTIDRNSLNRSLISQASLISSGQSSLAAAQQSLANAQSSFSTAVLSTQASLAAATSMLTSQLANVTATTSSMALAYAATSSTLQSITSAIRGVTSTMQPVGQNAPILGCTSSECTSEIKADDDGTTIQGTSVRVQTPGCGVVDICNVATAIEQLRGV